MDIRGVAIRDTFSEGFSMIASRILVTAADEQWAMTAAREAVGFATSVIGCGCEADVEEVVTDTPDGRPGVAILFFATDLKTLEEQMLRRIGNCVLTCPTTACFNGFASSQKLQVGKKLRYFGDGWQSSKMIGERRYWRIPVMEGEFLVEESYGFTLEAATGNFLILAAGPQEALRAATRAVSAIREIRGVILPFPGGVVRSGSKVGSRYSFLRASTMEQYCPTLQTVVESALPAGVYSVLEIVICGLDGDLVIKAMQAGILAACVQGVIEISAGNYGGDLGDRVFFLRDLMNGFSGQEASHER